MGATNSISGIQYCAYSYNYLESKEALVVSLPEEVLRNLMHEYGKAITLEFQLAESYMKEPPSAKRASINRLLRGSTGEVAAFKRVLKILGFTDETLEKIHEIVVRDL